jgi:hypothetical protein
MTFKYDFDHLFNIKGQRSLNIQKDCIYYDLSTISCSIYGSCHCFSCPNYIKKSEIKDYGNKNI